MTRSGSHGMCGRKRRFADAHEAERRARPYGQRVYHCSKCDGWHCTKEPFQPRPVVVTRETYAQALGRARMALAELERKHVTGPLLEAARANLAQLLSKGRAA